MEVYCVFHIFRDGDNYTTYHLQWVASSQEKARELIYLDNISLEKIVIVGNRYAQQTMGTCDNGILHLYDRTKKHFLIEKLPILN